MKYQRELQIRKAGYPEKVDRNREIYNKKKRGATYRSLSSEYDLAINTILKIVTRWRDNEKG